MQRPTYAMILAAFWSLTPLGCGLRLFETEVLRLTSPNREVDAVLVEINGGATTTIAYSVYLVHRGQPYSDGREVAGLYGALKSPQTYGVNLRWSSSYVLSIDYLSASSVNADHQVELASCHWIVELHPNVNDLVASPISRLTGSYTAAPACL